jgi:hypothetical protein
MWVSNLVYHNLRGEHNLRAFENRILGRIFGPKREKVIGSLEKIT